jgi:TetR/AcrR family transcriptional regulator, transcriptional repressor for nem operon
MGYGETMARPREFDRDDALRRAMVVFWEKGYAATSTDDLLAAMRIGRQSLYNAFGDKRTLYLEALESYQRASISDHVQRLNTPASALDGLDAMLVGLVSEDSEIRGRGCMGVGAVCEFGSTDPEIEAIRAKAGPALHKRLVQRLKEGQAAGEIDAALNCNAAASFIQITMQGIQLAARAGADANTLRSQARFAIGRLKAR